MDVRQLEAFVYVVKFHSFSKAADYICLTQPTISAHIRALEKELGIQLLVRSTKEVYPTKKGRQLFDQALNILALRDQALQSVMEGNQNTEGEIYVIASSVPAQYLLPQMIAGFRKEYPKIIPHIHQTDSGAIAEKLDGYFYDLGVSGMKLNSSRYIQTPFYNDVMVLIYPAAYTEELDFTCENLRLFIKTHPFVMREQGSASLLDLARYLEMYYQLSLSDLQPAAYFNSTQGVLHAVAHGLGISFVSKVAVEIYQQKEMIHTIEMDPIEFQRQFYIVQNKDLIRPVH